MSSLSPTRVPVPARAGFSLAAALLAAACGSSASGGSSGTSGASAGGASHQGTVITTRTGSDGTFLTDGSGHSVYLWVKDPTGKSVCSGSCASAWPPVSASGTVTASGGAKAADLGSITRSDGTKQVTYDGHPLYYFAGDSSAGQTNGEGSNGFGAKWWLVSPSGAQLTGAGSGSGTTTPSPKSTGGGGYGGGGGGGY